jgi:hypothetical protein
MLCPLLPCSEAADLRPASRTGNDTVGDTMKTTGPVGGGGTTEADHRTALRFVLGRPGWRVEARTTTRGVAHLELTTPCPGTNGQRSWEVTRTREGLLVLDGATGRRLWTVPAMRDALVAVWEAVTDAAPD